MSVYEIGLLSGLLSIFINYCLGKPGGTFSPYEILSRYTVWLSKRRLIKTGIYKTYQHQMNETLLRLNDHHEIVTLKMDFKVMLYNAADPFFTWERAAGMCSVCTGGWVSVLAGLFFTTNFVHLVIIVLISHITIRVINKIL